MNTYSELYKEYFYTEDNVIELYQDKTGRLILGLTDDLITIGWMLKINDSYELLVDSQFIPNWNTLKYNSVDFIKPKDSIYQIMFNVLHSLHKRDINYKIDINKANVEIDKFGDSKGSIDFINKLRNTIKENIQIGC